MSLIIAEVRAPVIITPSQAVRVYLGACCVVTGEGVTASGELYGVYELWAHDLALPEHRHPPISHKRFSQEMMRLGFTLRRRFREGREFVGVSMRPVSDRVGYRPPAAL